MKSPAYQKCINPDCAATFDVGEVLQGCPRCGNLLDVMYEWERVELPSSLSCFSEKAVGFRDGLDGSGVWRFRELLPFDDGSHVVSMREGNIWPMCCDGAASFLCKDAGTVFLQHEGYNPTGSFKDNGMTAAFTHARLVGAESVVCASTGNTSASMAAYAAYSGDIKAAALIGSGKIAYGKLCQAMAYGARVIQIRGNFDDAMARVAELSRQEGIYLMNSLNPFRLEGQKAIMYRVLEGFGWEPPDWVVVPGGNLGNTSAFGKAFMELVQLGYLERVPRLAVVVAEGAPTLYDLVNAGLRWNGGKVDDAMIGRYYDEMVSSGRRPRTVASAIEISIPVNLKKALRALDVTDGVVTAVPDEAVLDAQAVLCRNGLGCEPASAASLAGAKRLVEEGVISPSERIVCILTGHILKDPDAVVGYHSFEGKRFEEKFGVFGVEKATFANRPVTVDNDLDEIIRALKGG